MSISISRKGNPIELNKTYQVSKDLQDWALNLFLKRDILSFST